MSKGRPKKTLIDAKYKRISIRFGIVELRKLYELKTKTGMSTTDILRSAFNMYYNSMKNDYFLSDK